MLTYKAVVTSLPLAPLGVRITGDQAAAELLSRALSSAGPGSTPSLLVRKSEKATELQVLAKPDAYRIARTSDDRQLVVDVPGTTPDSAQQTLSRLEHIARWVAVAELKNPSGRLPADAAKLDLYIVSPSGEEKLIEPAQNAGELRFPYELVAGEWRPPTFKMRISNQSQRRLYCMLLDLPETYSIQSGLLAGNGQWLEPNSTVWATVQGSPLIPGFVPDELIKQGFTEIKDTIKLIASTEECDATLLDQPDLDVHFEPSRGTTRGVSLTNTLANLVRRVQTRHMGLKSDALAEWMTTQVTLTIAAPGMGVSVPSGGPAARLSDQVQLLPHPGLKAMARLSTAVTASRDPELPAMPPLPPWLVDDHEIVRPFELSISRGGEAGLSVLELDDVEPGSAVTVTPESPLKLRVGALLGNDEHILPISFDGEFFLPLGWAHTVDGEVEINLERLPEPSTNRRTLTGSIRIFFKKVISKYLGTDYAYPLLAIVDRADNDRVQYTVDSELIRSRISAAHRILLYIHGIIGDTRSMAPSAFSLGLAERGPTATSPFDVILTFDYENLNTPIEETARDLKQHLADIGLGPRHGKELHVVAHSMGGLVARWFIEREGGHHVVQHLVMLGTPNGGSPWPNVTNWVTTVVAIGLNGLSKVPWPPTVLGTLTRIATKLGAAASRHFDKIEVALGEMNPGSKFLAELIHSNNLGIRYSILAGNTSLVPAVLESESGKASTIQRLFQRLNPGRLISEGATALAFFGSPNDIAVSVEAITKVPATLEPPPLAREVACDHLTYFNSEAGLSELLRVLH